jgi:hypothetical protein
VTPELIQAEGSGSSYAWLDTDTRAGTTYAYWLTEVTLSGEASEHGPVIIKVDGSVADEPIPLPVKPGRRAGGPIAE